MQPCGDERARLTQRADPRVPVLRCGCGGSATLRMIYQRVNVSGRAVVGSARCDYPGSDRHSPATHESKQEECAPPHRDPRAGVSKREAWEGGEVRSAKPSCLPCIMIAHPLQPAVPKHADPLHTGQSTTAWQAKQCARNSQVGIMLALTSTETYSLSVLSVACISVLVNAWRSDGEPLFASLAISGVAFAFSYALIPWTADVFVRRGFSGKDLSKRNPTVL